MFPRVAGVRHLEQYKLELTFIDGTVAEIDFSSRVIGRGGVFAPLNDVDFFAQAMVDPEAGTVTWSNGVDFCPDVLYAWATGKQLTELGREADVV